VRTRERKGQIALKATNAELNMTMANRNHGGRETVPSKNTRADVVIEDILDDDEDDDEDEDEDDEVEGSKATARCRPRRKPASAKSRTQAIADDQSHKASAPALTEGAVPDSDPELRNLLHRAVSDETTGPDFARWLEGKDDPRADAVRDLFTPVPAIPPRPSGKGGHAMVAGREWVVVLQKTGVMASVYFKSSMSELLRTAGGREPTLMTVRVAAGRQTPEVIIEAFKSCRLRLLLALFGMTPATADADRVIRDTGGAVDDALRVLRRVRAKAVPWLCALRKSDPDRFASVMSQAMRDSNLRSTCDAVMDALDAGWREKLLAEVGHKK
jgi:hypothetical protein